MSEWSPPAVPRVWVPVGLVLWMAWILYTLVIMQQVVVGLFPAFLLFLAYVAWRFLAALEAIADAQQRLATERERENRE